MLEAARTGCSLELPAAISSDGPALIAAETTTAALWFAVEAKIASQRAVERFGACTGVESAPGCTCPVRWCYTPDPCPACLNKTYFHPGLGSPSSSAAVALETAEGEETAVTGQYRQSIRAAESGAWEATSGSACSYSSVKPAAYLQRDLMTSSLVSSCLELELGPYL